MSKSIYEILTEKGITLIEDLSIDDESNGDINILVIGKTWFLRSLEFFKSNIMES